MLPSQMSVTRGRSVPMSPIIPAGAMPGLLVGPVRREHDDLIRRLMTPVSRGRRTMFVQVFQGGVKDPDGLRTSLDRWITDLGPNGGRLARHDVGSVRRQGVHRPCPIRVGRRGQAEQ